LRAESRGRLCKPIETPVAREALAATQVLRTRTLGAVRSAQPVRPAGPPLLQGGSDFDPRGKSDAEVMRFCQSFMTELHRWALLHTIWPHAWAAQQLLCPPDLLSSSSPSPEMGRGMELAEE
jgi:hypothetical protein